MGGFVFLPTGIEGLWVIEPQVLRDERGYFMETYNAKDFRAAGIDVDFVQDNQSLSKRGVLRGLHYQKRFPQGKLVRVVQGEVFDVAVDLREDSATFKGWHGVYLSEDNQRQFYIPPGFAHGFLVLSEEAVFAYKCTDLYHAGDEGGILWDDPELGIQWPVELVPEVLLSDKDRAWGGLLGDRFNNSSSWRETTGG